MGGGVHGCSLVIVLVRVMVMAMEGREKVYISVCHQGRWHSQASLPTVKLSGVLD